MMILNEIIIRQLRYLTYLIKQNFFSLLFIIIIMTFHPSHLSLFTYWTDTMNIYMNSIIQFLLKVLRPIIFSFFNTYFYFSFLPNVEI